MRRLLTSLRGLTLRGRCLLASGVVLTGAAFVIGQRDLLRAGVLLLALPLVALVVVSRTRYGLACTRRVEPGAVEAGTSATVRLHLENVSRLPSGSLLMEDTLPYALGGRPRFVLDKVEPNGARDVSYPARSELRGRFPVGPLSIRLTDPFGLCELHRSFAATDELVVRPVVTRLPPVRIGSDWTGGGGETSLAAISLHGSDDVGTREYRHGDDLRRVHWRATARTGELMVRREEQPFQNRATIVLDGRVSAHRGDGPDASFEWAVSAFASIAVTLLRAGYALTLVRENGANLLPPGVPLTEDTVLDALATVGPSRTADLDRVVHRLEQSGVGGALFAVLGPVPAATAQRLARLRSGGVPGVAVLMDTPTWVTLAGRASTAADAPPAAVFAAAGWRVLPVERGTSLASVWPLAGGSSVPAQHRPVAPAGVTP